MLHQVHEGLDLSLGNGEQATDTSYKPDLRPGVAQSQLNLHLKLEMHVFQGVILSAHR